MKLNDIKLVIFDWDGTLFDTDHVRLQSIAPENETLRINKNAIHHVEELIGLKQQYRIDLQPSNIMGNTSELLKSEMYKQMKNAKQPDCFFPGIMKVLEGIKKSGRDIAIISGASHEEMKEYIRITPILKKNVSTFRTADQTRLKPHPEMLWEICKELNIEPRQALLIGDSHQDIEMARRAGMSNILVRFSRDYVHYFDDAADHAVNTVSELGHLIDFSSKMLGSA